MLKPQTTRIERCERLLQANCLTDGRRRFIESIKGQLERGYKLSPHQKQIVDGLYKHFELECLNDGERLFLEAMQ